MRLPKAAQRPYARCGREAKPTRPSGGRPLPWPVRPAYGVLAAASVAMMPRWSRRPLGLPYLPLVEDTVVRAGGHVATRTIRWALGAPT